jgi:hypothetical protein
VRSSVVGIVVAVLVTACSGTSTDPTGNGSVRIQSAEASYAAGDTAVFTMENIGSTEVNYNACPFTLERRAGSGWLTVDVNRDMICDDALGLLNPGTTRDLLRRQLPNVPPGTYRYRFDSIYESGSERLPLATRVSNGFDITS